MPAVALHTSANEPMLLTPDYFLMSKPILSKDTEHFSTRSSSLQEFLLHPSSANASTEIVKPTKPSSLKSTTMPPSINYQKSEPLPTFSNSLANSKPSASSSVSPIVISSSAKLQSKLSSKPTKNGNSYTKSNGTPTKLVYAPKSVSPPSSPPKNSSPVPSSMEILKDSNCNRTISPQRKSPSHSRWAGGAFSNSPAPATLPIPAFTEPVDDTIPTQDRSHPHSTNHADRDPSPHQTSQTAYSMHHSASSPTLPVMSSPITTHMMRQPLPPQQLPQDPVMLTNMLKSIISTLPAQPSTSATSPISTHLPSVPMQPPTNPHLNQLSNQLKGMLKITS